MSGLVGDTPPSGEDDALPMPIERPECPLNSDGKHRWNTIASADNLNRRVDHPSKFVERPCKEYVSCNVRECLCGALLVQVPRDDCMNFCKCDLEDKYEGTISERETGWQTLGGLNGVSKRFLYSGPSCVRDIIASGKQGERSWLNVIKDRYLNS